MQHLLLVLAMILLMGIAVKERNVAKLSADNRVMQIEKVHEKVYDEEDDDVYGNEFNVLSSYNDFFQ